MKRVSMYNLPKALQAPSIRHRFDGINDWREPGPDMRNGETLWAELTDGWHGEDHTHAIHGYSIKEVADGLKRTTFDSCGRQSCCAYCGSHPANVPPPSNRYNCETKKLEDNPAWTAWNESAEGKAWHKDQIEAAKGAK